MAKPKKRVSPKRRLTRDDRVEMMQTGRKPKRFNRKQPSHNRKK